MVFHLHDGGEWFVFQDIDAAREAGSEALAIARKEADFDREWPDWVNDICVTEGPEDAEDPSELPCVLKVVEVDIKRPSSELDEDGYDDNLDWWAAADSYNCDFDLAPPTA